MRFYRLKRKEPLKLTNRLEIICSQIKTAIGKFILASSRYLNFKCDSLNIALIISGKGRVIAQMNSSVAVLCEAKYQNQLKKQKFWAVFPWSQTNRTKMVFKNSALTLSNDNMMTFVLNWYHKTCF